MDISRLAISQITTRDWGFAEDVSQYAALGIQAIGVWRDKVEAIGGVAMANKILKEHQMTVTNLCFAGLFTEMTSKEQRLAMDNAKLAIEQAKFLNAGCLLMVSGPVRRHSELKPSVRKFVSGWRLFGYASGWRSNSSRI